MKTHHIDMLEAAKKLLAEMDSNELINEFLELQTDACGPSVDDFFKIMMRTTDDLYGFNIDNTNGLFSSTYIMELSDWAIPCILSHSKDFDIKSANDEKYHLDLQEIKNTNSFLIRDDFYAIAS
jgi:hypothetical protein